MGFVLFPIMELPKLGINGSLTPHYGFQPNRTKEQPQYTTKTARRGKQRAEPGESTMREQLRTTSVYHGLMNALPSSITPMMPHMA
jgi:hypothetical protein